MCTHTHKQEGQRERDSLAGSTLSTEPDAGVNLPILRSPPELKPTVRRFTEAPQVCLKVDRLGPKYKCSKGADGLGSGVCGWGRGSRSGFRYLGSRSISSAVSPGSIGHPLAPLCRHDPHPSLSSQPAAPQDGAAPEALGQAWRCGSCRRLDAGRGVVVVVEREGRKAEVTITGAAFLFESLSHLRPLWDVLQWAV